MASCSSSLLWENLQGEFGATMAGDTTTGVTEGRSSGECEESIQECENSAMDASLWAKMPEELVEKILARLPFRLLFRTRVLSKSWALKMYSSSFQNEINFVARNWGSYCPLYVGNEGLIGYDNVSKRSEKILTLSYLPHSRALISNTRGKISGAGSLLCFVDCDHFPNIYVTNVVTRKWKILPRRPNMNYPAIVHLFAVATRAYKVILITPLESPCAQVYDSATNSWSIRFPESSPAPANPRQLATANNRWASSNRAWIPANNAWTNSAYFRGTLYVLWGYQYDGPCELLAYNIEEGTWVNIGIDGLRPSSDRIDLVYFISMSRILVCGNSVMVAIRLNITCTDLEDIRRIGWPTGKDNLVVFEFDPETQLIKEVSKGPPVGLIGTDLNEAACDESCIYFYQRLAPNSSMIVYNVHQQNWSSLPAVFNTQSFTDALKKRGQSEFFFQPTTFSFQPGLNLFVDV